MNKTGPDLALALWGFVDFFHQRRVIHPFLGCQPAAPISGFFLLSLKLAWLVWSALLLADFILPLLSS